MGLLSINSKPLSLLHTILLSRNWGHLLLSLHLKKSFQPPLVAASPGVPTAAHCWALHSVSLLTPQHQHQNLQTYGLPQGIGSSTTGPSVPAHLKSISNSLKSLRVTTSGYKWSLINFITLLETLSSISLRLYRILKSSFQNSGSAGCQRW